MEKICSSIQKSLKWCEGTPQYPGIKRRLYFCSKNDIVAYPKYVKDEAKYLGDFILAADKKLLALDIIPQKSQLTSEAQGETPSQTQLNKLTAVHPGIGAEASAAALYLNNHDSVFFVPDMEGKYRVVGCERWPAKITVAQDLGQGAAGVAATTISVEASDICPAPFYAGKMDTEEGIFMGDGSPVPDAGA